MKWLSIERIGSWFIFPGMLICTVIYALTKMWENGFHGGYLFLIGFIVCIVSLYYTMIIFPEETIEKSIDLYFAFLCTLLTLTFWVGLVYYLLAPDSIQEGIWRIAHTVIM